MPLIVGQNSWETVEEADFFLTYRLDTSQWFALPDTANPGIESKEVYLISAFYWLLSSDEVSLSKSLTDENVKHAQSEAALFLLHYHGEYEKRQALIASGVKEFKYSKWSETLTKVRLPESIKGLLISYSASFAIVTLEGDDYS